MCEKIFYFNRVNLVKILACNYSKKLESVCCQFLRRRSGSLSALSHLEVSKGLNASASAAAQRQRFFFFSPRFTYDTKVGCA